MPTIAYKEGENFFAVDEHSNGLPSKTRQLNDGTGQLLQRVAEEDFGLTFPPSPGRLVLATYETHYQHHLLVTTRHDREFFVEAYKVLPYRERLAFSGFNYGHKGDTARALGYKDITSERSYLGTERSERLAKRVEEIIDRLKGSLIAEGIIDQDSWLPEERPMRRYDSILSGVETHVIQPLLPEPDSQKDYKKWTDWGRRRRQLLLGFFLNPISL